MNPDSVPWASSLQLVPLFAGSQSFHRPSQGAAIFFAVSDDLKQRVAKGPGYFYNNLQSLH